MNIAWSGLADEKYYDYIAKYCLPSWSKLPGKKYVIHDSNRINIEGIDVINWNIVPKLESTFLKNTKRKKSINFWRKMQSQVWAARNLTDCDYLVLLDTDIEVLDIDLELLEQELESFKNSNLVWATGRSQSRLHDSGFIILRMNHPDLINLINDYENIWESGGIFNLNKSYDGDAVKSLFDKYPSYKIMNTDYGKGLHIYDVGVVHYGSKIPKAMRAEWPENPNEKLQEYIQPILVKRYKN
jgi:hypothetical protein